MLSFIELFLLLKYLFPMCISFAIIGCPFPQMYFDVMEPDPKEVV